MGDEDAVDDYFIDGDGDGGGGDGELRRALAGFCDAVAPAAVAGGGGIGIEDAYGDAHGFEQTNARKRARDESLSSGPKSKACREKMRRDKLNDRFLELSFVLNPGKPPKLDKANILSDAARMLGQLRNEAQQLKESNEKLRETIKDLKTEKNELRDEKISLRAEKERLEQQVKALSLPPAGFVPHPIAFHPAAAAAPFAPPSQPPANKTAPLPAALPGMAMWQWLSPAVLDTTQDPKLWPPNA